MQKDSQLVTFPAGYKGPWGVRVSATAVRPKILKLGTKVGAIQQTEYLDFSDRVLDQGYLGMCGGASHANKLATMIRANPALGWAALPSGFTISPVDLWEQGKLVDGTPRLENNGVCGAMSVLKGAEHLGLLSLTGANGQALYEELSNTPEALAGGMAKQPLCCAFTAHRGFMPENMGPNGEVAEALGPTPIDAQSGHLICANGIVASSNPADDKPIMYLNETWGDEIGFKGFQLCHVDEMLQCLIENVYVIHGFDPVNNRAWEKFVVTQAQVDERMRRDYPQ